MADFFDDMADVARALLAPTSRDGLGAGTISLVRVTPGTPSVNPKDPPPAPTLTVVPLDAQAFGVSADLVGSTVTPGSADIAGAGAAPGISIVATDLRVISAPITGSYGPEDLMRIDGRDLTILRVRNIPAAGKVSVIEFIVRG